jgi:hypothetical protein
VTIKFHAFLTSALNEGERYASGFGRFIALEKNTSGTCLIEG